MILNLREWYSQPAELLERWHRGIRFAVYCDGQRVPGAYNADTIAGMVEAYEIDPQTGRVLLDASGGVGYKRMFGSVEIRKIYPHQKRGEAIDVRVHGACGIPTGEEFGVMRRREDVPNG